MNRETFYFVAFVAGFAFSVLSFTLGSFRVGHAHGHFHHGHKVGASRGVGRFFDLGTIAAFLTWFGGAGYLLERHSHLWVYFGLLVSTLVGLTGAAIVFLFLGFLSSRERQLDPLDYEMTGVLGRVSSPIRAQGTGEILYMRDGARKAAPARSEDATAIGRDTEVIVTRYEAGVAYVRRWEEIP